MTTAIGFTEEREVHPGISNKEEPITKKTVQALS
jgi:hypothetical protein